MYLLIKIQIEKIQPSCICLSLYSTLVGTFIFCNFDIAIKGPKFRFKPRLRLHILLIVVG